MRSSRPAGSTGSRSYDATTTWNFSLATPTAVSLGLLGMTSYGGGFNSLVFSVKNGSTTLVNDTFTSLASAQTFFTDHALSLGTFQAGSANLVVDFNLTASSAKGADVSYLLSSLTTPARRGIGAPVVNAAPATGSTLTAGLHAGMAGSVLTSRLTAARAVTTGAVLQAGVGVGGSSRTARSVQ